jgi:hypothetical protein
MPKHDKVDSASSLYLALRLENFSIFGEFFGDLEFWFANTLSAAMCVAGLNHHEMALYKMVCCSSCTTGMGEY